MKYKVTLLLFLFSLISFAQSEIMGKIKTEILAKKELAYILHIPEMGNEKKPLIVFLHGSGEKGINTEKVKTHGPFKYLKDHEIDAFVLAPKCLENEYWDEQVLYLLISKIIKENKIDGNRIYLTGLSMGAWGAWNLVVAHPETFAAFVSIAGFVDRIPMIENCKIAAIPTRIFHGLLDDVVNVDYSIAVYKKLKNCSSAVSLTIFDNANHDSWSRVYDNSEIYDWMLKQTKNTQNEN